MEKNMLRLNDVKWFVGQINGQRLGLEEIIKEIKAL
jgi:hypothetical protein